MKIVVVFLAVLVVTVLIVDAKDKDIGGAAAGETTAEAKKKKEEDTCNTLCLELKEPALNSNCKESCAVKQRAKTAWLEALHCSLECTKLHGLKSPATFSCEEGCKKEFDAKKVELTASCNTVCSKTMKEQVGIESCKKMCEW